MVEGDVAAFQAFEREGWDRGAAAYDRVWRPLTAQFVAPLLDAAGVRTGERLLDLACGPGYVAAAAAARGAEVVGVDLAPAMVAAARSLHPGVDFRQGSAEELDFPDATFDCVVMGFGINHVASPEAVFREVARVLRPRGRVAYSAWASGADCGLDRLVEAAVTPNALPALDVPRGPDYSAFIDPARCAAALAACGFEATPAVATLHRGAWRVGSPREVFEAERWHGVRTAALLACQPPDRLERIRAAMEAGVAAHREGDGYAVPVSAWVIVADRP